MKNNKIQYGLLLILLSYILGAGSIVAQKITVTGIIHDTNRETITGVTIIEKGTNNGTTSDANGLYKIEVSPNATLVYSFIGLATKEIPVKGQTKIDVILQGDAVLLDEIVAIGFGTSKKVNLTGAVGVADSKQIENRPVLNTFQALQGTLPGLNLTVSGSSGELGGSYNVNIRGFTSINGGSPLVLVDGISTGLEMVNPLDIESVTILKDQASAAIYGARAGYGVLMITTKKGTARKPSIEYSNNLASRSPLVLPKNMSSLEFATMFNTATTNDNVANLFTEDDLARIKAYLADPVNTPVAIPTPNKPNVWGKHNYSNANTDWYSTIYKQHVFDMQHNLSLSGGSENIQYYVSGSFLKQDGLLKYGDDVLNKYTFIGKINAKITDWIRFNMDVKWALQKVSRPTFASSTLYSDLSLRWPNNYVKDPNGYYSNFSEILKLTEGGRHDNQRDNYITTGELILEPLKGWTTNISLSQSNVYGIYQETTIPVWEHGVDLTPVNVEGVTSYFMQQSKAATTTFSAYSTYEKQLDSHYFKGMLGGQYENYKYALVKGQRQNLIANSITALNAAYGDQFATDNQCESKIAGLFGRLNYNYKNTYLLEVNARYDATSRFPEDSRGGLFPSVSVGYVLSQEGYWDEIKEIIDFFKLRASYGKLGNQSVSTTSTTNGQYYPYVPTMPVTLNSSWIFPDNSRTYVSAATLVSPDMTWETVKGWNLGFTGYTLNNRFSVDLEVYRRITENMFGPVAALPVILGTSAPKANNATLETKGYEITLGWNDQIGKFKYNLQATLADYKGIILEYNNPTLLNTTYYEGSELGAIWGYVTDRLFQEGDDIASYPDQSKISSQAWKPGDVKYKDLNGDNVIDYGNNTVTNPGDRTIIGNNTPRYSYSFVVSCSYKNFDFNMFWQGIGKRDLWISNSLFWGMAGGQWSSGGFKPQLDYWTPENPDAFFPRPLWSTYSKNLQCQSRYLLDASYCRLKSLQVGYTIPFKHIVKKCRVYLSGENLLTITNMFENFDPEVENNGLSYPLQSALSVGCNIAF
jgi:TonB-linked SusC/RagA family outer membrane protein